MFGYLMSVILRLHAAQNHVSSFAFSITGRKSDLKWRDRPLLVKKSSNIMDKHLLQSRGRFMKTEF